MKKTILISILISFMLVLGGCSDSSSKTGTTSGSFSDSFSGGTNSLEFEFLDNAPPKKIRDQGLFPFQVIVKLENLGEADIPENKAYVTLSGINPADYSLKDDEASKKMPFLRGKKKQGNSVIDGQRAQIIFSNLKYLPETTASFPANIFASLCYPYQTRSVISLCVTGDTGPKVDGIKPICEVDSTRVHANSGAPVQIQNAKQYPQGTSSIQFQFDIIHKARTKDESTLFEPSSFEKGCLIDGKTVFASESSFKQDKVKYTVETGIPGLDCEGTGKNTNTVTLYDNTFTVTCTQETNDQQEYEKPISITLDYDYYQRKQTTITVEHIDR